VRMIGGGGLKDTHQPKMDISTQGTPQILNARISVIRGELNGLGAVNNSPPQRFVKGSAKQPDPRILSPNDMKPLPSQDSWVGLRRSVPIQAGPTRKIERILFKSLDQSTFGETFRLRRGPREGGSTMHFLGNTFGASSYVWKEEGES